MVNIQFTHSGKICTKHKITILRHIVTINRQKYYKCSILPSSKKTEKKNKLEVCESSVSSMKQNNKNQKYNIQNHIEEITFLVKNYTLNARHSNSTNYAILKIVTIYSKQI